MFECLNVCLSGGSRVPLTRSTSDGSADNEGNSIHDSNNMNGIDSKLNNNDDIHIIHKNKSNNEINNNIDNDDTSNQDISNDNTNGSSEDNNS